jgi:hypothetical protein
MDNGFVQTNSPSQQLVRRQYQPSAGQTFPPLVAWPTMSKAERLDPSDGWRRQLLYEAVWCRQWRGQGTSGLSHVCWFPLTVSQWILFNNIFLSIFLFGKARNLLVNWLQYYTLKYVHKWVFVCLGPFFFLCKTKLCFQRKCFKYVLPSINMNYSVAINKYIFSVRVFVGSIGNSLERPP